MNKWERGWQARDNNKCQREYASDPINQYRVGRTRPTTALTRKQPDPHAIAANCRWQHLIEECGDEADL